MNKSSGDTYTTDSPQERVSTSEKRKHIEGEVEKVIEEEMLRAIEREHKSVTTASEDGGVAV